jgi:uncharacterized membrane protein YeaQ/YmgE (transglycosylase-associated protein family)
MTQYLIQAAIGAVVGYVGNYLPFVKNNQSTITNVALGLVGSVGGNAVSGAAGLNPDGGILGTLLSGGVGSIAALLAGKLFGNKAA